MKISAGIIHYNQLPAVSVASKPSVHMDLLGSIWETSLRPHWSQGSCMLYLHGRDS